MDDPKFAPFEVSKAVYKTVNGHPIPAYVFIPKNLSPGKHPVIAKFHGGFLITGSALYAEWFAQWTIDYAIAHQAIVISVDYRLMPEATGLEILEDIDDFWKWLRSDFSEYLAEMKAGVEPDFEHVIANGESAGGYVAILSALSQPAGTIKAVMAAYPVLDINDRHYTEHYDKAMFGAPMMPASILDDYIKSIKPGDVITSAVPPARMPLALVACQQGKYRELLGSDSKLYPMEVLKVAKQLPFTFIFHGTDDSAVPVEGSVKFAEAAKEKFGAEKIEFFSGPGEHGFDDEATLETPWMKEGLAKVTKAWLK